MQYLIDTYNLLHAAAAMAGVASDMGVRRLCQFIIASPRLKVTLVMDGRPKPDEPSENEFPDINLVWSGTGIKADLVIAQRVERAKHRKKLTVVSNDREVVLHARRNGASAMSCEAFVELITQRRVYRDPNAPKRAVPQSPGEAEHWMKEFGLENPSEAAPKPRRPADPEIGDLDIESLLGPRGN